MLGRLLREPTRQAVNDPAHPFPFRQPRVTARDAQAPRYHRGVGPMPPAP
jgi:hypothetical protein